MHSVKTVDAVIARQLYDGYSDEPKTDQVIEVANGRITSVRDIDGPIAGNIIEAPIVAPGFIDLQINGANDTQFNFDPTISGIESIAVGARKGGTAYILPTFITAPGYDYRKALEAAKDAINARVPGVLGVHLEGPFLSPERPGIHPARAIRSLNDRDLEVFRQGDFPGVLMLTLAPECQPDSMLRRLSEAGVVLSVGHSAASLQEIRKAERDGLRLATHLFNAMPPITGRDPGVAGAVLTSESLYSGIIADGIHVDWANVALAARMLGDRLCVVTDAMLTLAGETKAFDLYGQRIFKKGDRLANSDGRLAGAHVAMDTSVQNLVRNVGLSVSQALKMASTNPADAIGRGSELGRVAPGYRAALTCLDCDLRSVSVIVDGRAF